MHTDWPARRVIEQCESAAGCKCLLTGEKKCPTPQACELAEEPKSRREAVSPMAGVLYASALGSLLICLGVWVWRSL